MNALAVRARGISVRTWLIVLAAGMTALGAWFLVGPLVGPGASEGYYRPVLHAFAYGYNRPMLLLFVPYGLALLAWRRGSRVSLRWLLFGAIGLHLMLLFAPTPQSYDIHQYLFYGRMQALHVGSGSSVASIAAHAGNPYVIQPSVGWSDEWFRWVKWPTQTTVYGPVWSLLAYGVALLSGGSHTVAYLLMKTVIFGLDLAIIAMIVAASRERADPAAFAGLGILAYAWNPVVLVSVPLGGLADVALAAGLLGAYLAARSLRTDRTWLATALLTLTALVKVYAGIALILWLVLVARRRGVRSGALQGLLAAAIAAILFAPYWAGAQTFRGLLHVANLSNHSFVGALQSLLTPVLSGLGAHGAWHLAGAIVRYAGTALLLAAVVWAVTHTRTQRDLWHNVLLVLSVYFLFTPWFFYWYLVAPIALVAVLPEDGLAAPTLIASGTLLISISFPPWLLGRAVEALVRYLPPVIAYAFGARLTPAAPDEVIRHPATGRTLGPAGQDGEAALVGRGTGGPAAAQAAGGGRGRDPTAAAT